MCVCTTVTTCLQYLVLRNNENSSQVRSCFNVHGHVIRFSFCHGGLVETTYPNNATSCHWYVLPTQIWWEIPCFIQVTYKKIEEGITEMSELV